ncbi:hypothetical protein AB0M87_04440 [Streptomyces sp. NPDC051320]|uniref:hypothetical protein n=1 Tax=Streptomyces sp. NPDC051320 TaxID=3154644 RepID=UPI0034341E9F
MEWASKVPDAMDALVVAFRTSSGLEGVTVWDGPTVSKATPQEMLSVGFTGVDGETDAESSSAAAGMTTRRDMETFTVRCAAAVLRGSTDVAAVRRRAYELLAAAGEAIARDETLGGVVLRAMVGSHTLTQDQTSNGAQAVVAFGVDCEAFTGR